LITNYDICIIHGIAYQCPVGDRCKDCQLILLDGLSFKDKIEWIEKLSDKEIKHVIKHHNKCSKMRDNGSKNE
jgi:hypothetical protein